MTSTTRSTTRPATRPTHRVRRTAATLAGLACLLAVALSACGSSDSSSASSDAAESTTGSTVARGSAPASAPRDGVDLAVPAAAAGAAGTTSTTSSGTTSSSSSNGRSNADDESGLLTPQVISTGDVALRSGDVGAARFRVQQVVDRYQGQITDDTTAADDGGDLIRSREVLRVPATHFRDALLALGKTAELVDTSAQSQDVTTEVIDNAAHLKTQQASIDRIRTLLARAGSVRTIVSIESELSRREATLDSLEQRQAYLADQTAMSTITVSISKLPEHHKATAAPEHHHRGFLAGLHSGWSGFTAALTGVATAGGAALPFALLVLVVGVPAWLLVRRRRAATPAARAAVE